MIASSRRTVRLTPQAVEALRNHRKRQLEVKLAADHYEDLGLVFAGKGGGLINPSNLRQRSFAPLLESAGLPQITFHNLHAALSNSSRSVATRPPFSWWGRS